MELIKTVIYWIVSFSWRNIAVTLISFGSMGGGTLVFNFTPDTNSFEAVNFIYSNQLNEYIGLFLILIGSLILVVEIIKGLKKRALIFHHLGIDDIKTFDIASARPVWDRLHRPEPQLIDCYRFYQNGIVRDPNGSLQRTLSIGHTLQNYSQVSPQDLKIYYGGMVQVPFAFVAGTILSNTMKVEVYDWDREKEKAYSISEKSKNNELNISVLKPQEEVANELCIEFEISYPICRENTLEAVGDMPTIKFSANPQESDNASTEKLQNDICKKFHSILDEYSNVPRIHIFIAAQNSLVFQLGRQVSLRVHPEIIVWQYENQSDRKNPWGVAISSQGYKVFYPRHTS